jgi:sugar/nucleoside kinase (ribokinase family)
MDLSLSEVPWKEIASRWAYIVPGNIPFKVISEIVNRLHAKGVRIAMNPSRFYLDMGMKKLSPILEKLSVGIFSREEATRLTHMAYEEEHQVFEKLHEAIEGIVAMTDGAKGAWVSDCRRRYVAGVYNEREVADRTGAGDAFGSGFVAGLIKQGWGSNVCDEGTTITKAISLASANATSVVEHVGAQAGILKKKDFEKDRRWRNFPITVKYLNSWKR